MQISRVTLAFPVLDFGFSIQEFFFLFLLLNSFRLSDISNLINFPILVISVDPAVTDNVFDGHLISLGLNGSNVDFSNSGKNIQLLQPLFPILLIRTLLCYKVVDCGLERGLEQTQLIGALFAGFICFVKFSFQLLLFSDLVF